MAAHHSALQIDTFAHTHRADSPIPGYIGTASLKTFQICLGVQMMRTAGLFHIPEGIDYGIVWPLLKAAEWAPTQTIRQWILDLLNTWPLEGVMVFQRGIDSVLTVVGSSACKDMFGSSVESLRSRL